ncbi:MAG: hypothetical protein V4507_16095 [Verrucomicrobiota bacterium]
MGIRGFISLAPSFIHPTMAKTSLLSIPLSKIAKSLFKAFTFTLLFTPLLPLYSELNLQLLSTKKDLWPKELVLLEAIHYNSGKKFPIGIKVRLLDVQANSIIFESNSERYSLPSHFTNLRFLVDESLLSETSSASPTLIKISDIPGPDFSFLLNTRIDLTEAEKSKAIDLLISEGGYLKVAAQLGDCLLKGFENGDSNSNAWKERLIFAQICFLLGQSESSFYSEKALIPANPGTPLYRRFKPETLRFFLSAPPALTKTILALKNEDNLIGALTILEEIWQHSPEGITEYPALSGAFAVVYDQLIPQEWPHTQVTKTLVPLLKEKPWIVLFDYYRKKDQENSLATKIKEMSVSELKFVVDAPLEISEFEWALKEERQSRGSFDRAYFDVDYDLSRIKGNEAIYSWPHDADYTLANIKKNKGICIDQSYFSSISAKAFGIPSISISGQGSNCSHAWLGFMPSSDKWNMKGGRYEANNYVVGYAWDPQTWKKINDHELEYLSQRYNTTPEYEQSQYDLILANLLKSQASEDQIIKLLNEAKSICSKNPAAWFALEKHLQQKGNTEDLKSLYEQMIDQFSSQKDWKTQAQEKLAKLASKNEGSSNDTSELTSKIIQDNRGKRSDLAIDLATRAILQKIQTENYDESFEMYQNVIKKFGKENGLTLIRNLTSPFTALALAQKQDDLVDKILKVSEKLIDNTERQASLNQTKQSLDYLKAEVEESRKAR